MISPRMLPCLVFVFAVALANAGAAQAQNDDEIIVPLTDPARPAAVTVATLAGNIVVRGTNRRDVLVRNSGGGGGSSRRGKPQPPPPPGLRRLTQNEGFTVEESNNAVSIGGGGLNGNINFEIEVPLRTNLKLNTVMGNLTVTGVDGTLELNSVGGALSLANVAGSVVAHTVNGDVSASLTRADAGAPMAFTTLNGEVDVTLPASVKASLRLRTDMGDVFTDFDIPATSPRPAPRATRQRDGRFHLEVERAILANLNGGGPDIELRSFNGRVYLRRGK